MTENKNRCVVTGLGMICAIGNNVNECWDNAIHSVSGIKETHSVDTTDCYSKIAAEVSSDLSDIKTKEYTDRVTKLCLKATSEAMADAKLTDFNGDERVAVILGSCVGGVLSIEDYYTHGKDTKNIRQMPISALANQIATSVHAGGVVTNIGNACAAGTISVSYACDLIREGRADIVIAGGSDAFASVPYSGFLALHALDENPCAPFNKLHGITLGEGSGVVIVESYEHALKRNAKMYCEVLGAGVTTDAFHITAPRPDGECQMDAIRLAMKNSGCEEDDIGYINAHGTGTVKNDEAEFLSLHTIFDEKNDHLTVSSTKAMTGHCLGAAGAIESVFAIKALTTDTVPPTLGFEGEDFDRLKEKGGKIDFLPNKSKHIDLQYTMDNSFAFGGNNASIIYSKNQGTVKVPSKKNDVVITGFSLISPIGNCVEDYVSFVKDNKTVDSGNVHSSITNADFQRTNIPMSSSRKMDVFCSYVSVAGVDALANANITVDDSNRKDIGIVVGTSEGALGMGCQFQSEIATKGNAHGSPFNFPKTVYNAAGGYLSMCANVQGYNVTITNGAMSGLASICYAKDIINLGKNKTVVAVGSDENTEIISELYNGIKLVANNYVAPYSYNNGFVLSDGAVGIIVEDKEQADSRNAKEYCRILGYGIAHEGVPFGTIAHSSKALDKAIAQALKDASITVDQVSCIVGFGNGQKNVDSEEIASYQRVFSSKLSSLPVFSTKNRLGEGRAMSSSLSVLHASLLLNQELKEDTAYFFNGESLSTKAVKTDNIQYVLVTAFSSGGSYTAVILAK